uniref:Uncharacterized protein n=1 Tax=Trypanosoma vivax (strain Y486) TaxID=1055687 RepID=G0U5Q1_TRYVY|nr:hypothetical protein TVY486_1002550 [Trypanosoma vivax Y486]
MHCELLTSLPSVEGHFMPAFFSHTFTHKYIHTCMHTYIYIYIYIYTCMFMCATLYKEPLLLRFKLLLLFLLCFLHVARRWVLLKDQEENAMWDICSDCYTFVRSR